MTESEFGEPVEVEITDVIDLHSFQPRDFASVTRSYLDAAYEAGFRTVRIIHGKGAGVQRGQVRALLERDPRVLSFDDAEARQGGRGATVVQLA